TFLSSQAAATPAGIAATAKAPTTTPARAALLLDIRAAVGGGRRRAADHAGDGDQRQHVREDVEERRRRRRVDLQPEGDGAREAEEQRRGERARGPPVAEDHRRQRDKAPAVGHVVDERPTSEAVREVDTAERREDAGNDDAA